MNGKKDIGNLDHLQLRPIDSERHLPPQLPAGTAPKLETVVLTPKVEPRQRGFLRSFCCSCVIGFIIFLVIAGLGFAFLAGQSGLYKVPLFRFTAPAPAKTYVFDQDDLNNIDAAIKLRMEKATAALQNSGGKGNIPMEFSEYEINGLLQKSLLEQKKQSTNNPIQKVNVLLDGAAADLSVVIDRRVVFKNTAPTLPITPLYLHIAVEPKVANNVFDIKITKFKIGNLRIPSFLPNMFLKSALGKESEVVTKKIPPNMLIQSVSIADKSLKINLEIK